MAASKPASAAKIHQRYLRTRDFLGVTLACILAASCSVSDTEPQLSLAPASDYETSASGSGRLTVNPARPQARPEQIAGSQKPQGDQPASANVASATSEAITAEELKQSDIAADKQQEKQPSRSTTTAEETENKPAKSGLFQALFASAPSESRSQEAVSASKNKPATGKTADAGEANSAVSEAAPAEQDVEAKRAANAAASDENKVAAAETVKTDQIASQKRGFLSAFFSSPSTKPEVPFPDEKANSEENVSASTRQKQAGVEKPAAKEEASKPIISLASASPTQAAMYSMDALPGVRPGDQLFEIRLGSQGDDGDVDVYEQEDSYQVASAAGLARLAPNGLLKQRESVNISCFKPQLVHMLKTIERRFGKRVVVTSGYRSPEHNRRVRGAPRSQHMNCAAADIVVEGVSKWELARFARSLPNRGGVGTYCHTRAVHVDIGPERDWNWRCRGS